MGCALVLQLRSGMDSGTPVADTRNYGIGVVTADQCFCCIDSRKAVKEWMRMRASLSLFS